MKKFFAALLCLFAFSAYADDLQNRALTGQGADIVSTVGGLTLVEGLAEANPIWPLALIGKVGILSYANSLPEGPERDEWHRSMSAAGFAASTNNFCWIVVVATGGTGTVLCPVVGIAAGVYDWSATKSMTVKARCEADHTQCQPMIVGVSELYLN